MAELLEVSVEQLCTPAEAPPIARRTTRQGVRPGRAATGGRPPSADADWRSFPPLNLDAPLTAALAAFLELGYHGSTMRDIAGRAGLSVPGVYHYYPSKHDMLVAILDLTMGELLERSTAARAEGRTPVERFTLLVECLALFHTHRKELGFVGASEMRSLAREPRERVAAIRRRQQQMVDEEVQQAVLDGDFTTDRPHEASRAVVSLCTGLSQWYSPSGPTSAADVAQQYVQFALDLVRQVE